ncbi:MAG: hypothetical protein ACYTG0_39360 [Planctomycetota bacterium]|jgi:hypothetical protein
MWCIQCRQDVPGQFVETDEIYRCPRCADPLARQAGTEASCESGAATAGDTPAAPTSSADAIEFRELPSASPSPEPPTYDHWELEERLRHVERVLSLQASSGRRKPRPSQAKPVRIDAAHGDVGPWHHPTVARNKATPRNRNDRDPRSGSWVRAISRTLLAMGLCTFACGGAVMAWSASSGREDLWTIGLPVGLVGQVALLIGLILQLDRLWHDNRHTAERLRNVDEKLHDLNTTTTLLGTGSAGPSGAFYAHMAGGASPKLLLADLKSQLDLLAVRLSQSE